jgi:hypothetical protein
VSVRPAMDEIGGRVLVLKLILLQRTYTFIRGYHNA